MRRREFVGGLGGALLLDPSGTARAQSGKPFRIGMLRVASPNAQTERFKARLTDFGYVESRDYVLDIDPTTARSSGCLISRRALFRLIPI
jgi:hypothetical protein